MLIVFISGPRLTSICILRWVLKRLRSVKKIAKDNSKTSGTDETPFLDNATHRYCLMAVINMSLVRNTGPAFCRTDRRRCRDRTLERSSWDLQVGKNIDMSDTALDNSSWTDSTFDTQIKMIKRNDRVLLPEFKELLSFDFPTKRVWKKKGLSMYSIF